MVKPNKDLRIVVLTLVRKKTGAEPSNAACDGFTDEDFKKPMIGIASTWSEVTPCNMHIINCIKAKAGAREGGGLRLFLIQLRFPMEFRWDRRNAIFLT